jgi:hypothetical protein
MISYPRVGLECRGVRIALALLAALSFGSALATPFAVQVGDVRLALDAPPGFADTQFTGSPRLIDLAESMTPASNRILLFALEDGDLRRFMVGDSLELRRSVIAVTPRAMERESLSLGAFKAFATESLRSESAVPAPSGDLVAYLDSQPPGRANPIASLRSDPEVVSVLLGTRLPSPRPEAPPRYLVSSHTLLLVRGKALDLSVFSRYESPVDLEWIRAATARWIDELQRLNSR